MYHKFTLIFITSISLIFSFSTSFASERIASPLSQIKQKYPTKVGESAEILEKRISIDVNDDNVATTVVYKAIRINDPTAVDDYSQISIQFNDFFEHITLDFANILTANGQTDSVRDDAIQIKSGSSENFFVDTKTLAFALPSIQPNAIIEFQFTLTSKQNIIPGEFFDSASFSHWEAKANPNNYRLDYVHFSQYQVAFSNETKINYFVSKEHPINYTVDKANNIHRWQIENIPSVGLERFAPRSISFSPYINISTIESWQQVAQWGRQLFEPTIHQTAEIKRIAQKIALENTSTPEKIRAVFDYMQNNIRYVFAHVGRGGFAPHTTNDVFNNGYGDCKDQSVLTIALLRALNIEAYPALVATTNTSIPNDAVPMSKFDHMITYIPKQKGTEAIWLDTVGGNYLFPGISHMTNKQTALIIAPKTTALTKIESPLTAENLITVDFHYRNKENLLLIDFTVGFQGAVESDYRDWIRFSTTPKSEVENFLLQLYPDANIENLTIDNATHPTNTLRITGTYEMDRGLTQENLPYHFGLNASRIASLFSLIPKMSASENRQYPFAIDNAFTLKINAEIDKPTHYVLQNTGTPHYKKNNITYDYYHKISDDNQNNKINVEQYFIFKPFETKAEDYKRIFDHYKALDDIHWHVHLKHDESSSTIASLKDTKESAQDYVELIQAYLDKGEYEQALELANDASNTYVDNGNIIYLKGLAYAYIGNADKADKTFEKAEELGYDI